MFTTEDLGGHCLTVQVIFNYALNTNYILVLTDDVADGLCHVYYGPSIKDAMKEIEAVLTYEFPLYEDDIRWYLRYNGNITEEAI